MGKSIQELKRQYNKTQFAFWLAQAELTWAETAAQISNACPEVAAEIYGINEAIVAVETARVNLWAWGKRKMRRMMNEHPDRPTALALFDQVSENTKLVAEIDSACMNLRRKK